MPTEEMFHSYHEGVLSQTLTSSPAIKTILPAKIRSPLFNDVILVGHTAVHLHEFWRSANISGKKASLELGAQILAAKVVSAEAKTTSIEDSILKIERDEIRYKINSDYVPDDQPPQILVLSLSTGELAFLYAKVSSSDSIHLMQARRKIPRYGIAAKGYGKYLVVDNSCRVLVSAPSRGELTVMRLKTVDKIKEDIDVWNPRSSNNVSAILEQRIIPVDGNILQVDFLYPPPEQTDLLTLILLVANAGVTKLLGYRWFADQQLTTMQTTPSSGYALLGSDSFPNFLIPSQRPGSFALVVKDRLIYYNEVDKRSPSRVESASILPSEKGKLWVHWTKPIRHAAHVKKKEDIYFFREDGQLAAHSLEYHSENRARSLINHPGSLGINIDAAICSMAAPPSMGGDILIACGDGVDGGIFQICPGQAMVRLQTIPNYSPLHDTVIFNHRPSVTGLQEFTKVIAVTGPSSSRCLLTELSYGLEARAIYNGMYDDARGIDRIWALEHRDQDFVLFLASHSEHTTAATFSKQDLFKLVDPQDFLSLDFTKATLAASHISGIGLLQITTGGVHILHKNCQDSASRSCVLKEEISCANIFSQHNVFALCVRKLGVVELQVHILVPSQHPSQVFETANHTICLEFTPVDVVIATIAETLLCVVACPTGTLEVYIVDMVKGIEHVKQLEIRAIAVELENTDESYINSLAYLGFKTQSRGLLLVGLKAGSLLMLTCESQRDGAVAINLIRHEVLGNVPVKLQTESEDTKLNEQHTFVLCGPQLRQVVLRSNREILDFTVEAVVPTYKDMGGRCSNSTITAIGHVRGLIADGGESYSGCLVCAAGDNIMLLSPTTTSIVSHPIHTVHHTRRVVYSPYLKKCLMAVDGTSGYTSNNGAVTKATRPFIQVAKVSVTDSESPPRGRAHFGDGNEKIRALLVWTPSDGTRSANIVIIGTELNGDGRLAWIDECSFLKPSIAVKQFGLFPRKPITALCSFKSSTFVMCAGRDLMLTTFNPLTHRSETICQIQLPSQAKELRAVDGYIYVATLAHSVMIVQVRSNDMVAVSLDVKVERIDNILPYDERSLLVNAVYNTGSKMLGLSDPVKGGMQSSFEADLPLGVDTVATLNSTDILDKRVRFVATTIDGAVYLLTKLSYPEITLLSFLEDLCQPLATPAMTAARGLANGIILKHGPKLSILGVTWPPKSRTHTRGDTLKGLLEPGPYNLHYLLQRRIKVEPGVVKEEDELTRLVDLARPVIGDCQDTVGCVLAWLRMLLNVPAF